MRRKQNQKNPYSIKEFYPRFFWHKCNLCHEEFKREVAWKIKFPTITRIICINCAPIFSKAEDLALTWGENGTNKPSMVLTRMVDNTPAPPKAPPGIKPPSQKCLKYLEKGAGF